MLLFAPQLGGLERRQVGLDLVIVEAGHREVEIGQSVQLGKELAQLLLIPVARDLVQGEVEELGLLLRDIEEDDRDPLKAEPLRRDEPLVAADHMVAHPPDDDRVHEAELLDAALQVLRLCVGDGARVVHRRPEGRDLDVLDLKLDWMVG